MKSYKNLLLVRATLQEGAKAFAEVAIRAIEREATIFMVPVIFYRGLFLSNYYSTKFSKFVPEGRISFDMGWNAIELII